MFSHATIHARRAFRALSSVPRRLSLTLAAMCLLLAGCGDMSGTYEAEGGSGDKIEFKGDNVYVTIAPAPTMAGTYEIDGDKVVLMVSGQSMALTRNGESLEGGPFGVKFVRK